MQTSKYEEEKLEETSSHSAAWGSFYCTWPTYISCFQSSTRCGDAPLGLRMLPAVREGRGVRRAGACPGVRRAGGGRRGSGGRDACGGRSGGGGVGEALVAQRRRSRHGARRR